MIASRGHRARTGIPALAIALCALALAALLPARAQAARAVPGEIVVRYRDTSAHASGLRERGKPPEKVLRVRPGAAGRRLARLRARPDVAYAVPNYIAHAATFPYFDDPGRSGAPGGWEAVQWNLVGPFGVNAINAWRNLASAGAPGGHGTIVAVLDTGVAYRDHRRFRRSPDLSQYHFVQGHDFVGHDIHSDDRNGHGTHVASTIAETADNGIGVVGLAYGARIMPVRVLDARGDGDGATISRGIRWAARHGADVINLSLEFSLDVRAAQIPDIIGALRYAHRKGAVVVGAAGNEAQRAVAYPARSSDVISVGATTADGCIADYSNEGRGLDVVAPGGGNDARITGDPNCHPRATGPDIVQMTYTRSIRRFGLPGGYEGTSMAAPHVSATAALVIASGVLGPHPSPDAVERQIERTARDLGTSGYDVRYGYGLIDAAAATAPPAPPAPPAAPAPAPSS